MNRIDRLTAILILLQSRRVVPARAIADRYGISLRTVYRDIRALEEAGVPIGAEAGLGYFLVEGYHLPPVMFTTDEAGALLLGGKLVERFSDGGASRHFAEAMDKIKAVLGHRDQDYINRLDDLVTVLKAASPKHDIANGGLLIDLQAVLTRQHQIRIEYWSGYKDEHTTRVVEPLGLCFYAGHWHLLAFCHLRGDYRDFRVDRVKTMQEMETGFNRGRHGNLEKLVERIVLSTDLKAATVRFNPDTARFIRDQKYYLGFVDQRESQDGVEMDFLVPDYNYLSHWLISFTDQVTVLSPETLKKKVQGLVARLARHYGLG
jgi:predicted DNA-binding transcriptional regulator YafY